MGKVAIKAGILYRNRVNNFQLLKALKVGRRSEAKGEKLINNL
jgi:hypothetical protein